MAIWFAIPVFKNQGYSSDLQIKTWPHILWLERITFFTDPGEIPPGKKFKNRARIPSLNTSNYLKIADVFCIRILFSIK